MLDLTATLSSLAPTGAQRDILNKEAYSIGRLVGAGEMPAHVALDLLTWAAGKVPSADPRRPWRADETRKIIEAAFVDGQRHPREVRHAE